MNKNEELINAVGVRFKKVGKVHYYTTNNLKLKQNDKIVAETIRGLELGTVVIEERPTDKSLELQFKPIIRIATNKDLKNQEQNEIDQKNALDICYEKIREFNLQMKLIDVEYTLDKSKLLFYFTAEGRIDFRELVKSLAGTFKTRIELRQIGVRDEAKILNSIGICGRPLCCSTFLYNFQPVSLKMAKDQNLSLNPTKISGSCGRLMCCLNYEQETYEYLNENLPNVGDFVQTPNGKGEVMSVSALRETVKVVVRNRETDDAELLSFHKNDVTVLKAKKFARKTSYGDESNVSDDDLKGLLDE